MPGHRGGRSFSRKSDYPEYRTWVAMRERCAKNLSYQDVPIQPEWRLSFEIFYDDVGPKPSPNHSLDRIDGSKGYIRGNVRWATRQQQVLNRANTRFVKWKGEDVPLARLIRLAGVNHGAASKRFRRKHPIEVVLYPGKMCDMPPAWSLEDAERLVEKGRARIELEKRLGSATETPTNWTI